MHDGQLCLEVGEMHPCRGSLYFGDPAQESKQLAAFCRLEERIRVVFADNASTQKERAETAKRAAAIIEQASTFCLFPRDGYCYSCGGNVTFRVIDLAAAASYTSCHLCGRTWCD